MKTSRRVLRFAAASLLTVGTLMVAAVPASAAPNQASCGMADGQKARFAAISKTAADAIKAGQDVDTALANGGFCLSRMTGVPTVQPLSSTKTSVTVSKPTFLYDNTVKQIIVSAGWDWVSPDYANQDFGSGCCYVGNDGGKDSFGIAFCQPSQDRVWYSSRPKASLLIWNVSSTLPTCGRRRRSERARDWRVWAQVR